MTGFFKNVFLISISPPQENPKYATAANTSGINVLIVFFGILNKYYKLENESPVAKNLKVTLSLDSTGIANLILVSSF